MGYHGCTMQRLSRYIALTLAVVAVVGGLVWLGSQQPDNGTINEDANAQFSTVTEGDWTEGNPEANVVIVEYGDFQCPACAAVQPYVSRVIEDYGDEVVVVFRHLPLTTIHKNALSSAWAAEAAGMQGKFFEMGNMLYARQSEWSTLNDPKETYEGYAEMLGLDLERFRADYASDAVQTAVRADMMSAQAAGLSGTPTFFLNGARFDKNPTDYDIWQSVIEDALAATSQNPAAE